MMINVTDHFLRMRTINNCELKAQFNAKCMTFHMPFRQVNNENINIQFKFKIKCFQKIVSKECPKVKSKKKRKEHYEILIMTISEQIYKKKVKRKKCLNNKLV